MTIRIFALAFIVSFLFACQENIKPLEPENTVIEKRFSKEDSLRLNVGLMLIDSAYVLDTIMYGIRHKLGLWKNVSDTTDINNLTHQYFYSNNIRNIKKKIEYLKDSIREEEDRYQYYNKDSSIKTTLILNYNHTKNIIYYGLETVDFKLQKKNKIEIEKLKKEREENIDRAKKDSIQLYECGASYHTPILELSIAHIKYEKLSKIEFDSILKSYKLAP
jgi:hypothetical protein